MIRFAYIQSADPQGNIYQAAHVMNTRITNAEAWLLGGGAVEPDLYLNLYYKDPVTGANVHPPREFHVEPDSWYKRSSTWPRSEMPDRLVYSTQQLPAPQ